MPAHLTSVKTPKKENTHNSHGEIAFEESKFPHGLSINLNDQVIKQLGMDMPAVGEQMIVLGIGRVTSVSERSTQRNKDRDISIQIEELEVAPLSEPTAVDALEKAIKDV